MNKMTNFAVAGLIIGVLIAEFDPNLFSNAFGQIGAAFEGPFSHYRNHLALRWGALAAAVGAGIGFLAGQRGGN